MAAKMAVERILCLAGLLWISGHGTAADIGEQSLANVTMSMQTSVEQCPLATCQGHCGKHSPPWRGGCFCDPACLLHGDCCPDYLVTCQGDNTTQLTSDHMLAKSRQFLGSTQCVTLFDSTGARQKYDVVVRCPPWAGPGDPTTDEHVRALCEDLDNDPHISQLVPVFDTDHQVIYRNWYCASCHNATSPTVLNPKMNACGDLTNDALLDVFIANGTEAFNTLLVKFCMFLPLDLITNHFLRRTCPKYTIVQNGCNKDPKGNRSMEYEFLEVLCHSHQSVVYDSNNAYYGNVFCALCQGVMVEDLTCLTRGLIEKNRPKFGNVFPSFSVLLDFTNAQSKPSVLAKYIDEPLCANKEVIDKIENICVAPTCPYNHVPFNDGCAQLRGLHENYTKPSIIFEFSASWDQLEHYNKTFPVSAVQSIIENVFNLDVISFEWTPCNDSSLRVCAVYYGRALNDDVLHWNLLIEKSEWKTVYDIFIELFPLITITVTNYNDQDGPQCQEGFIWMEDPALLSEDLNIYSSPYSVYMHDRTTNISFSMASVAVALRLDKTGQRLGFTPRGRTIVASWNTSMKCGYCQMSIMDCDKVMIKPATYILHSEDTQGIVVEVDGINVSVKAGEYLRTAGKNDSLVVCARSLPSSLSLDSNSSIDATVQGYLTMATLIISISCLLATICTHMVCPKLRTVPGHITVQLCLPLLCAQLLFLINKLFVAYRRACRALAVLQHVTWLAAFCWMNVFALDVCKSFLTIKEAGSGREKKRLVLYGLYSWGAPCLFALGWLLAEQYELIPHIYGSIELCWIRPGSAWILYTVGVPLGCVLLVNLVCLLITVIIYKRITNDSAVAVNLTKSGANKNTLAIALKLTTVMGLPWACGFLANIGPLWPLWYVFVVLNASQGVFIFVTFICKRRVYMMLKNAISQSVSHPGTASTAQPPKTADPGKLTKDNGAMVNKDDAANMVSRSTVSSGTGVHNVIVQAECLPQFSQDSESGYVSTRM